MLGEDRWFDAFQLQPEVVSAAGRRRSLAMIMLDKHRFAQLQRAPTEDPPRGKMPASFDLSTSKPRYDALQRLSLIGILLSGLAGCAAPLPKLASTVPAQWQHLAAVNRAQSTDARGWWRAFGDPELDALVDRALANNLDVAQAVERLRAVRVLRDHAGGNYLPSLGASTNDVIDPDASASYFLVGFDASWEIGLFGRAEGTRRESQGILDASVADLRSVQVSLVAEVVRKWIELRAAQQQQALLSKISQHRRREWQLLRVRQHLSLVPSSAVDQAEAAFAQSRAALAAPRQAIVASVQQLAALLGQNLPDPAWLRPAAQPDLGSWTINSTPADLLRTRPEIARAEADVLQAAGAQALAHADMFPRIGLGGSIDWSTDINNNHRHATTPNAIDSFGPEINVPLFDWGLRLAAKHAKDHELKASVLAYRQAVLQGIAEVETALGSLQQQQQREQQQAVALQALQRVDESVRLRQRLHLSGTLDRVESQIIADQAALELAEARAGHSLAYVALFKALGGAPLPSAPVPAKKSASAGRSPVDTDEGPH
jgi:NodT family efflux transporter outer membrane factor (OMF) lipoprotein